MRQHLLHGCGSHFPVDQPPEAQQPAWDRESEQEHRRVEVFFFPKELGIVPPPPAENSAAGSLEYPAWLATASEKVDLTGKGVTKEVTLLEFHDALLRTDSCVMMPEGEAPTATGKHQALTSVGLVASILRFNEEHPGKRLLVAGHTDTAGSEGHNLQLSKDRAEVVYCLLVGGDAARKRFGQLAEQRSTIHDYQQVLSWLTAASPLTPDDGSGEPDEKGAVVFDCAPPAIDGKEFSSIQAVEAFQEQYNAQREALGAGSQPKLSVDGDVGPKTWSAMFDCYEFALRCELGEDAAGLDALRKGLVWADSDRRFLGFGEHHPVDNLGRDGYRSQANRRVEVLFFDEGEVPDLAKAEDAPEQAAVYLPGRFVREHVEGMLSVKPWRAYWERAEETAKMGDVRQMFLEAPGLPAGTEVEWCLFQCAGGSPPEPGATWTERSADGAATGRVDDWFQPSLVRPLQYPFPAFTFLFEATAGGRRRRSGPLRYADALHLALQEEHAGPVGNGLLAKLYSPWGMVEASADTDGHLELQGIPPGGLSLCESDFSVWTEGKVS